jgi:hypothetical protein
MASQEDGAGRAVQASRVAEDGRNKVSGVCPRIPDPDGLPHRLPGRYPIRDDNDP